MDDYAKRMKASKDRLRAMSTQELRKERDRLKRDENIPWWSVVNGMLAARAKHKGERKSRLVQAWLSDSLRGRVYHCADEMGMSIADFIRLALDNECLDKERR